MAGNELSLAIELTAHCNQKCGYCYNGWREDNGKSVGSLRPAELVALVERALTEVDFHHVTLTGGEPFSYPGLLDVLEVVGRHGKRAKIISNGGMITDALAGARAAGLAVSSAAPVFLSQANAALAEGDYMKAYEMYQRAYQALS